MGHDVGLRGQRAAALSRLLRRRQLLRFQEEEQQQQQQQQQHEAQARLMTLASDSTKRARSAGEWGLGTSLPLLTVIFPPFLPENEEEEEEEDAEEEDAEEEDADEEDAEE